MLQPLVGGSVLPQLGSYLVHRSASIVLALVLLVPALLSRQAVSNTWASHTPARRPLMQATEYQHSGTKEGSTAIALDGTYMLVGDDENNIIRLYKRHENGVAVKDVIDLSSDLGVNDKVDIEGSTLVSVDGKQRIYWIGSHSNTGSGNLRPARYRLFATDLQGQGANATLDFVGYYAGLRSSDGSAGDLITWGDSHLLTFSDKTGNPSEAANGINIEGLTMAPDNTTVYVGFRAPLIGEQGLALIAPIENANALVTGAAQSATIGMPILLNLGGRGIRSIERNADGDYLIIAGGPPGPSTFGLYTWDGNPQSAPQEITLSESLDTLRTTGSFEGMAEVPTPLCGQVQLIVDDGDSSTDYFRSYDVAINPCSQQPATVYLPLVTAKTVFGQSIAGSLVPFGAVWKYLDNGSDLGSAWRQPAYDDSGWQSGPAPLGYGDPLSTLVGFGPDPNNKYITTYFRHAFDIANPADYRTFRLKLQRDDAAVVYLNGTEVYSNGLPLPPVTNQTLAIENVSGNAESAIHEALIDASFLVPGRNVIAVEIHQDAPNSTDIRFDLSLAPAEMVTLVRARANWKYQDSGQDLGVSWRSVDFDDSQWTSGTAPLGYGDPVSTTVGFGANPDAKFVTTYFRQSFQVGNPALYEQLELTTMRDDGVVVYLNDVEIYRDNLPVNVDYQTLATTAVGGIDETIFQRQRVDSALLRTGKNVLAVEVHQSAVNSSDLGFDLSLRSVPIATDPVQFAVIGDYGVDSFDQWEAARLLYSWGPDFIVSLGDNRYGARTFDTVIGKYYCAYLKEIEGGTLCPGNNGSINRFFPATGNHDYSDGNKIGEYTAYFKQLPGTGVPNPNPTGSIFYYDFVRGPIHFFVVDSQIAMTDTQSMDAQKIWLQQSLAGSSAPWQVVYFHHPSYSSNQHGNEPKMQWPFAAWGADLVLTGHDHDYERIHKDGIVYIVNGAGGATLRPFKTIIPGSEARNASDYGAQWMMADNCTLRAQFVAASGQVIDEFTLAKDNCQ